LTARASLNDPAPWLNAVQIRLLGQARMGVGGPEWRMILSVGRLTR
jgi:hypothetical protein